MTQRLDLIDLVRQLTTNHQHTETYQVRNLTGPGLVDAHHTTRAPSLLAQLWANDTPGTADAGAGARPAPGSRPAARLESLDTATRINHGAADWIHTLTGNRPPVRYDTRRLVQHLGALAAALQPHDPDQRDTLRAITRDIRSWWTAARIVTGWDSPAWAPDNTCPACTERGTLRVRLAEHIGMCTNDSCRTVWDESVIGLLADHIRAESDAEKTPQAGPGPCWCPYPKPVVADLTRLCPGCGSARCRHAVGARLLDTIRAQAVKQHAGRRPGREAAAVTTGGFATPRAASGA